MIYFTLLSLFLSIYLLLLCMGVSRCCTCFFLLGFLSFTLRLSVALHTIAANLLVNESWVVKVADFGKSRYLGNGPGTIESSVKSNASRTMTRYEV